MPEGASYGQEAKRKLVENLVRTALAITATLAGIRLETIIGILEDSANTSGKMIARA